MAKLTTFLTYSDRAEEAAAFYVSIFKNSRIVHTTHYPDIRVAPRPGAVMTVEFELDGRPFVALNGGDHFKFTDGFSLAVQCETQQEIDHYWTRLVEGGGEHGPCGWLRDRFGVSWQVNPRLLAEMLADDDPVRTKRVMEAMLTMSKIEIAPLQRAYQQA